MSNDFHMVGVYTSTDTAKVVNDQSYWNPAYAELIRPAMGKVVFLGDADFAIAVDGRTNPQPTGIGEINLRPEGPDGIVADGPQSACCGKLRVHREPPFLGAMPPVGHTARGPFVYVNNNRKPAEKGW